MLIFRYFSRELVNTLLTVTLFILIIFLGNQLMRYLNDATAGNMALGVLGRLLLLEIPYLLTLLLPITLFIASLLTLGRSSADNELIALQACGITPWQKWRMMMTPCLSVFGLVAVLAIVVQPKISLYRNQLLATTNAGASLETLVPGKFQAAASNQYVFYVEQSSFDHKQLKNIFIAEKRPNPANPNDITQWNIIKAKQGYLVDDPKTHAQFISINDGIRYQGAAGLLEYQIMHFGRYMILTRNPPVSIMSNQMDALGSLELISLIKQLPSSEGTFKLAAAELEWRIALPLTCLLLTLLALFMGEVPPRQSRYARLFPGILILIVYTNMLFVTRSWVGNGTIALFPGIFWVPLITGIALITCRFPWKQTISSYRTRE